MLDKVFKLQKNKTNARTEIMAGLITFMTMAYILALNPNILSVYGMAGQDLWNGIFLATCLSSAIACIFMAVLANKPFCLAPGMGLNSFMALIIANVAATTDMNYLESFQTMMCVVLFEGIIFLALTLFNVREKLFNAIPMPIRMGMTPAIGLMIMNIGLGSNIYIANDEGNSFYVMRDFFGAFTAKQAKDSMGTAHSAMILSVLTLFFGLFIIIFLHKKKFKASVLVGMIAASVFNWVGEFVFLGNNPFEKLGEASFVPPFKDMASTTLFKFNFAGLTEIGFVTITSLIFAFCIIDMFDTMGTLVGAASIGNMLDEEGKLENMKQALASDAIGTITGACAGTTTVTTFVESATGIEAGGRTGLTSLVCGIAFAVSIFLSPIVLLIPAAATSSALVYVGIIMFSGVSKVDWSDITNAAPVVIMILSMPITGSIGSGIGLAMIVYTIIKMFEGKFKEVPIFTYIVAILFLIKFFVTL